MFNRVFYLFFAICFFVALNTPALAIDKIECTIPPVIQNLISDKYMEFYVQDVQSSIRKNWHPPKSETSYFVRVAFTISKNGELSCVKVITSSGNKFIDELATDSIERTKPFKPFPIGFTAQSLDIKYMLFKYEVDVKDSAYARFVGTPESRAFYKSLAEADKKAYNKYLDLIESEVTIAVLPLERHFDREIADVRFVILKDGGVCNVRLARRSKDKVYNQEVIKALQNNLILPPLPSALKGNPLSVSYRIRSGIDVTYGLENQKKKTSKLGDKLLPAFFAVFFR